MKSLHSNKKGVALLTVVLFFLVMVILLGGLLFATVNNLKNTQTAQKHTSVYYAAESGINLTVSRFLELFEEAEDETWLVSALDSSFETLKNQINTSENIVNLKGNLGNTVSSIISVSDSFTVTGYPNHKFFTIQSIGTVGDIQRTLSVNFGYEYIIGEGAISDIAAAVIVKGSIIINNGEIIGPIVSNMEPLESSKFFVKNFGKPETNFTCALVGDDLGDITLPQEYLDKANLDPEDEYMNPCPSITKKLEEEVVFDDVGLPPYPSYSNLVKVTQSKNSLILPTLPSGKLGFYIEDLDIKVNDNFEINLGQWAANDNQIIILRVKKVSQENGVNFEKGNLVINGKGRLMLLVDQTSEINIRTNINIDDTVKDPNKFMLILRTENKPYTLRLANQREIVSSILTDSTANIDWINTSFYGFFVSNAGFIPGEEAVQTNSGTVLLKAGTKSGEPGYPPIWVYAPHANIRLESAGTHVFGTIMGYSFTLDSNNGSIKYLYDEDLSYPFHKWTKLPDINSGDPANSSVKYAIFPIKEN